jgi:hypothetical protein
MNSKLTKNNKNISINWNKPQLIEKSNPAGTFIVLSTGCKIQETTFEGIVVYSKNPTYKIGEYSSMWGKGDATLCDQSEEITLSN